MDTKASIVTATPLETLQKYWGYGAFRSIQSEVIDAVMQGEDVLALMPTGAGKSITFQLPAMMKGGVTLVITPLIALMDDQVSSLTRRGIPAASLHSGHTVSESRSTVNRLFAGDLRLLYISPERLESPLFRQQLAHFPLSLIAVDEAHCISEWGEDFRPSYRKIGEIRSLFPSVPVLAITATANAFVRDEIMHYLNFRPVKKIFISDFYRENLSFVARACNNRVEELIHILDKVAGSAIIYVRRRDETEELMKIMNDKAISATAYHAGLDNMTRKKRQKEWTDGTVRVMVATNAFGMGIDKEDVRVVIHYGIPDAPGAYFQEAGRAGRDGKQAYAVLLYNDVLLRNLQERSQRIFPDRETIRHCYDALCDFFNLFEGDGEGSIFLFDEDRFFLRFPQYRENFYPAVRLLENAGMLLYEENFVNRTRIQCIVTRDALGRMRVENSEENQLMEYLGRHYEGLFSRLVYVDEVAISKTMNISISRLHQLLFQWAEQGIIRYIPESSTSAFRMLSPRMPSSFIRISTDIYEDRRRQTEAQATAMENYLKMTTGCRQLFFIRYFGVSGEKPCGICDLCTQRRKTSRQKRARLEEEILNRLQTSPMTVASLTRSFSEERETVVEAIQSLLEEEKIRYLSEDTLALIMD